MCISVLQSDTEVFTALEMEVQANDVTGKTEAQQGPKEEKYAYASLIPRLSLEMVYFTLHICSRLLSKLVVSVLVLSCTSCSVLYSSKCLDPSARNY